MFAKAIYKFIYAIHMISVQMGNKHNIYITISKVIMSFVYRFI